MSIKSKSTQIRFGCDFCADEQATEGKNPYKRITLEKDDAAGLVPYVKETYDVCDGCLAASSLSKLQQFV